jgi:ferrous iron transport protein B
MANATGTITVALAGNPNSGKTTIFNNLTGARQHVGNYPGVTVEKKEGTCRVDGTEMRVVDLPGTYSLSAYSIEEVVTRNFIIDEEPDVVVDILDASNLERNLYLAVQLMELEVPLVLGLNMADMAEKRGIQFDLEHLSKLLGAPIVPMVGRENKGTPELLDAIIEVANNRDNFEPVHLDYGRDIEKELDRVASIVGNNSNIAGRYGARWLAIKLIEGDEEITGRIRSEEVHETVRSATRHIESIFGDSPEIIIADRRYGVVSGACKETVRSTIESRHTLSDQADVILANRALGLPIFFLLMYLVFELTFTLGDPLVRLIESGVGMLAGLVTSFWPVGSESPLRSLLLDGVIGGVGGVIVFLPNIMLLFLGIAFLEDTGYMARVAFIMDRVMHRIGLHGKSFIPMLIGFGCSVPAIMATRTLDSRRDRLTTMLVIPLMSCGARLPIYALFIPAFFPQAWQAPMLMFLYVFGIALAIVSAKFLRSTFFKGESTPLVMELPPYRMPTAKAVAMHMWERAWLYLKKAGTVILGISIVLWALSSFPRKDEFDVNYDGLRTEARIAYEAGVRALNSAVSLPAESVTLVKALDSDLSTDPSPEVSKFLIMRNSIEAVHGMEDGEAEGSSYQWHRIMRDIQASHPVLFPVVNRFIDSVRIPYKKALADIGGREQSEKLRYSIAGRIGYAMEPAIRPLGFDWRIGTAFIGAFAAKEVFVAQLGIVFSVGDAEGNLSTLRSKLRGIYDPLTAFCIMLFTLIAAPCMATIAVTRRESNSWTWALFQLGGLTALGYVITLIAYQVGRLILTG